MRANNVNASISRTVAKRQESNLLKEASEINIDRPRHMTEVYFSVNIR